MLLFVWAVSIWALIFSRMAFAWIVFVSSSGLEASWRY